MLTLTQLTPSALEITVEGPLSREDVARVLAEIDAILGSVERLDILADVRGAPDIHAGLILEELKHLPTVFRVIRKIDRVAVIADESWVRTAAKIEGKLIPGVTYQVYTRDRADAARAWLLRQSDDPRSD
jgi:hypothetical protein